MAALLAILIKAFPKNWKSVQTLLALILSQLADNFLWMARMNSVFNFGSTLYSTGKSDMTFERRCKCTAEDNLNQIRIPVSVKATNKITALVEFVTHLISFPPFLDVFSKLLLERTQPVKWVQILLVNAQKNSLDQNYLMWSISSPIDTLV